QPSQDLARILPPPHQHNALDDVRIVPAADHPLTWSPALPDTRDLGERNGRAGAGRDDHPRDVFHVTEQALAPYDQSLGTSFNDTPGSVLRRTLERVHQFAHREPNRGERLRIRVNLDLFD